MGFGTRKIRAISTFLGTPGDTNGRWTTPLLSSRSWVRLPLGSLPNEQFFLVDALACVLPNARRASAGKIFFARKFAFCAAAGAVGSFPTFRLFANNAVLANGRFA